MWRTQRNSSPRSCSSRRSISAWLTVSGFVNAEPGYAKTTAVLNPVSDLLLAAFGPSIGRHARTAIGAAALPLNLPVVIAAGNPGMASGGMGDVLTGIIAALLAQGLAAFDAARLGAWLHAKAADLAAQASGERGLIASDLYIPLRRLVNP